MAINFPDSPLVNDEFTVSGTTWIWDGSVWSGAPEPNKQDVVAGVSNTEISYLDGVTSAIQTQIDSKASSASGSLTNPTLTNPTVTNYTESVYSTSATSLTVDLANGTVQKLITTGPSTITLPSSVAGKSFVILIDFSSPDAITWAGGSNILWAGGEAPTVSESGTDIFTFFQDGTNTYGVVFGQGF